MESYKKTVIFLLQYSCNNRIQRPIAFITCIVEHLMAEGVGGSRLQSAPHDDYRPLEKGLGANVNGEAH